MRRRLGSVTLAVAAALVVAAPAQAAKDPLNGFRVKPTAENKRQLAAAGFDLTEGDRGRYIEIYATSKQARALRADGVSTTKITNFRPRGVPADYTGSDADWDVWTRYDAVSGDEKEQYEEQYDRVAAESFVKKESIGTTHLGRPIWALKVTKDADTEADNTKPAVLYNAQQHAREWLAGETCRRTLDFFVDNYGNTGAAVDSQGNAIAGITAAEVTQLVDTRELWFVCISNPDGFEYTFTDDNRLWRKNMADNDGDGVRGEARTASTRTATSPPTGASTTRARRTIPTSETFRGTGPASEPETKAMHALWNKVDFIFQKNDHTRGSCCSIRSATSCTRGRPTTGFSRRWPAMTWTPRSPTRRGMTRTRYGSSGQRARRRHVGEPLRPRRRGRAVHHQRRHDGGRLGTASSGSPPRARAGRPDRHRLRVPGRRGRHRGRVPAPPAVLA